MADTAEARRPYDNSRRREAAQETRDRIVGAGAELIHRSPVRDWDGLTVRAVAGEAEVSERTIYRHFGTERGLRDAVMRRLEHESGIDLDALDLDGIGPAAERVLRYVSAFGESTNAPEPLDPTLDAADARRRAALLRVLDESAGRWTPDERRIAASVLDLLWNLSSYEQMSTRWELDEDEAIRGITWAIDLVVTAVGENSKP